VNVFNTNDIEFHRRHRRLLAGPMSESSLKTVEPFVREKAELAMQRIGEEMASRGVADMFKWSLFFATDVIGELTFGESFRMLDICKVRSLNAYRPTPTKATMNLTLCVNGFRKINISKILRTRQRWGDSEQLFHGSSKYQCRLLLCR